MKLVSNWRQNLQQSLPLRASWAAGALLLAHLVFTLSPLSEELHLLISDSAFVLTGLLVVGLLARTAFSYRATQPRLFYAWGFLALAQLGYTLGDMIWTWYEVVLGILSPYPSVADALYLLYYPFFLIGVYFLPSRRPRKDERLGLFISMLTVMLAAGLVAWNFWVGPLARDYNSDPLGIAFQIAYLIGDMVLFWALITLIFRKVMQQNHTPGLLLVGAITVTIFSDIFYFSQTVADTYSSGFLLDNGWYAGVVLLGLAAVIQRAQPETSEDPSAERSTINPVLVLLPYVWLAAAYLLLLYAYDHTLPMPFPMLAAGVGIIIGLILARQVLGLRDNIRLNRQLQAAHVDLEARVEARTVELTEANRRLLNEMQEHAAATAALARSETRLRNIADNMLDLISQISVDGVIEYASPSYEAVMGYPAETLVGINIARIIHPEDREHTLKYWNEVLGEQQTGALNVRMGCADGHFIWLETSGKRFYDPERRRYAVILASRDVTARREAEDALRQAQAELEQRVMERTAELSTVNERLTQEIAERLRFEEALRRRIGMESLLASISTRFINTPFDSLDAEIRVALQRLGEAIGVDQSYVYRLSPDGSSIDYTHGWRAAHLGAPLPEFQSFPIGVVAAWLEALKEYEVIRISDLSQIPAESLFNLSFVLGMEQGALAVVPMKQGQSLIGAVGFHSLTPGRDWTDEDLALLQVTASIFSNAFLRQETERALKDSESLYRTLVETSPDSVVLADPEARILICNRRTLEMHGYAGFDELAGASALELIAPQDRPAAAENARRMLQTGRLENVEYLFCRKDGSVFPGEMSAAVVYDSHRRPAQLVTVMRDITLRKQSEQELLRRNAQLESLRKVSLELSSELDLNTLLESIANRAVELTGGDSGGFYAYRPELDQVERVVSVGMKMVPVGKRVGRDEGLTGRVFATRQGELAQNYPAWEGRLTTEGYEAVGCVAGAPVQRGDELLGVLTVASRDPQGLWPEDVDLLILLAAQAAIAIHNAGLYRRMQSSEGRLRIVHEIERAILSAQSIEHIAEEALRRLLPMIPCSGGTIFLFHPATRRPGLFRANRQGDEVNMAQGGFPLQRPADVPDELVEILKRTGSFLSDDLTQETIDSEILDLVRRDGLRSYASVNMQTGGAPIGTLTISDTRVGAFSAEHLTILHELGSSLALACQQAMLRADLHRQMQRLEESLHEKDALIEEVRQAEGLVREKEERLRRITDNMLDIIAQTDNIGTLEYVSPSFTQTLGYGQDEMIGRSMFDLAHPQDADRARQSSAESLATSTPPRLELRYRHKDGHYLWVEALGNFVYDEGGRIAGAIINARDITGRKQMEAQIQASLREKEVLLKEIHHRVKNNLQVISSLLSLQTRQLPAGTALNSLRDSQNRIRSMALIHEKLYRSSDLARIDFGDYVRTLVSQLVRSYRSGSRSPDYTIEIERIFLDINQGIPCGLIINELISNALKYAFPPGREAGHGGRSDPPQMQVVLKPLSDEILELVVADNGIGLPPDIDYRTTQSLGLQLVNTLATQLKGTMETRSDRGAYFRITFPYTPTKENAHD